MLLFSALDCNFASHLSLFCLRVSISCIRVSFSSLTSWRRMFELRTLSFSSVSSRSTAAISSSSCLSLSSHLCLYTLSCCFRLCKCSSMFLMLLARLSVDETHSSSCLCNSLHSLEEISQRYIFNNHHYYIII